MAHWQDNQHELNTRLLRYRSQPDSQDPRELAEALLSAERFGDARGVVVSAQPTEGDDPQLLLIEGKAWMFEGQLDLALARLVTVLAGQPEHADALLWLGRCLLLRDDPLRAEAALARAAQLEPELPGVQAALTGARAALARVQSVQPDRQLPEVPEQADSIDGPIAGAGDVDGASDAGRFAADPGIHGTAENDQPGVAAGSAAAIPSPTDGVQPTLQDLQEKRVGPEGGLELSAADPLAGTSTPAEVAAAVGHSTGGAAGRAGDFVDGIERPAETDIGQGAHDGASAALDPQAFATGPSDDAVRHDTSPGLGPVAGLGEAAGPYAFGPLEEPEDASKTASSAGDLMALVPDAAVSSAGELDAPHMVTSCGDLHQDAPPSASGPKAGAVGASPAGHAVEPLSIDAADADADAGVRDCSESAAGGIAGTDVASRRILDAFSEGPTDPGNVAAADAAAAPADGLCSSASEGASVDVETETDNGSAGTMAGLGEMGPAPAVPEATDDVLSSSPQGVFRGEGTGWAPDVSWDGPVAGAFSDGGRPSALPAHVEPLPAGPAAPGVRPDAVRLAVGGHAREAELVTPVVACNTAPGILERSVSTTDDKPLSLRPIDVPVRRKVGAATPGRWFRRPLAAAAIALFGAAGFVATRAVIEGQGVDEVREEYVGYLQAVQPRMEHWRTGATRQWARWAGAIGVSSPGRGGARSSAGVQGRGDPLATPGQVPEADVPAARGPSKRVPADQAAGQPAASTSPHSPGRSEAAEAPPATSPADVARSVESTADANTGQGGDGGPTVADLRRAIEDGQVRSARRLFRRLPRKLRKGDQGLLLTAEIELAAQRPWRALDILAPLRARADRSAELLTLVGRALYAADQVNRAAGAFDLALAAEPDNLTALIGRGEIHLRAERSAAAVVVLERAMVVASSRARRHLAKPATLAALLGHAYLQRDERGDRELAYKVLSEATKAARVDPATYFWLGESVAGLRTPEASAAYTKYLVSQPEGRYAERARRALGPLL